ncbi:MAG: MFS transporter [Holophagales bacterium]|nr:MFS transporter [Holophagales bacterium]
MAGAVLGPIDASIVNVVLPTLSTAFSASLAVVQWVPMAYLLASGGLVLFFGRLGDLRGHRRVFLAGLLAFVGASALCAAAPTIHALIAFRALQGATSAALMSVPLAILTATFPPAERGKAIGLFAASISVGLAVGPSLGGALTAAFGWRAAFLVNLPLGLIAWAFVRRVLPEVPGRPGRLDLPGAATALGALVTFLLFVNRAQQDGLSARTLPFLFFALACGALFLRLETRAAEPMVALSIFDNRRVAFGASAAVLNFMAQYVVVFLTPFFLSRLLGEGPGRVGLVLTAFPLAVLVVAPFAGALSDRIGSALPAATGAGLSAAACVLLATMPAGASAGSVAWRLTLFGAGTGLFQSPNNSLVMGSAPRAHLGVVGSLLGTARTLGMVLGVAAAGAVLYAFVPASALSDGSLRPEHVAAFAAGVRRAYAAGAGFAVISALLASATAGRRWATLPA